MMQFAIPSGLFVFIYLRRTMIVLSADLHVQPFGPGIFLAGLLRRLNADLLCVGLSTLGTPDWYVFGHSLSYRLSIGIS